MIVSIFIVLVLILASLIIGLIILFKIYKDAAYHSDILNEIYEMLIWFRNVM